MTAFNGATLTGACPERSRRNAEGNLTNDGTNSYIWDARGHLSTLAGTNVAAYQYDAFGRRTQNTLNGLMTQYLYDGLNPVQELNGASPPVATANMLTGLGIDEYFQRSSSNGTFSYLTDMLGSTLALADSSGSLDTTYTYDPFGNVTVNGADTNPYQFTGRENDATGLYYYRARYYSPTLRRFVSQDPAGFGGGDADLYTYTLEDPVRYSDPLGLLSFQLFGQNIDLNWSVTLLFVNLSWDLEGLSRQDLNISLVLPPSIGSSADLSIGAPQSSDPTVCPFVGIGRNLSVGTNLVHNETTGSYYPQGLNVSFGPSIGLPIGVEVH